MRSQAFDVFCSHCNIQTEVRTVSECQANYRTAASNPLDEADALYNFDIYYVCLCRRCSSPFLIRESYTGVPAEFESKSSEEVLFPSASRLPLDGISPALKRTYEQALQCYGASLFEPCVLMCRRTLEAICHELGAGGRTLQAKLDTLAKGGLIDGRLREWAHGIRAVGNEAAHDFVADISNEDARDVLDFTEAILMYVFILRSRFDAFQARRRSSGSSEPSA